MKIVTQERLTPEQAAGFADLATKLVSLHRKPTISRAQKVILTRAAFVGYTFEAPTRFDKLFSGIAVEPPSYINLDDRSGREHITPAATFDADYSALLAQAQNAWKGWRARQGSNILAARE